MLKSRKTEIGNEHENECEKIRNWESGNWEMEEEARGDGLPVDDDED